MSTTTATAKITAGQLDQRLTLQQRAAGQDGLGSETGAWVTVRDVWGKARPLRSRELMLVGQLQLVTDVEFVIRWAADVQSTWRVLWRGVPHDITGQPADVDGQQQWLVLLATSGVRDGL